MPALAPNGPSYLPRNWREAALWLALVVIGAFAGRCMVMFAYHATSQL